MLLSTDLWAAALIRRAELAGAFATVARKGDARAGTVIVKAFDTSSRRARLYSEAFGPDGERLWMQPVESEFESELDDYLQRQIRYDPDLWIIEIEDREGRHFITEKVAGPRGEGRGARGEEDGGE
ncbi:DUF1491 family protein [Roseibacterium beibuensis]|uniref:DUF1491 family protein n=1 Tax=[Roseibacterium] beibuensis TaxID=1193142 RepID=UPI00217EEBAB|nr:DUF1491 family protein [Roseibacterium beibuensis]MCS6627297.1 DUF1491 family protein [Roseibacterium beibuensis]